MKEEIRLEMQRRIAEKFEQARGPETTAPRTISEEERREQTARYADLLIKAALRNLGR